jgi:methionyl-tRNA synthetase
MLAKDAQRAAEVQGVCTQGLNLFRTLMIFLEPILPAMAAKCRHFFNEPRWTWDHAQTPLRGCEILPYAPLATRLDPKAVAELVEPEASAAPPATAAQPGNAAAASPQAPSAEPAAAANGNSISIDEFSRVDLRVARIVSAELIAGADKLLKLRVDIGELGEREIFAGIRSAYDPRQLVGRLIVVVANLAPRKMRFGTSAGMVLAAGPGGGDVFLLSPDSGASAGMRVK